MSYRKREDRVDVETLQKMAKWAELSEFAFQAIGPIIAHLVKSYVLSDMLEDEKIEEIEKLQQEIDWLEARLEEEVEKNSFEELVIH
jgi:hypothetical protein